jgi:hypothetical protein
MPFAEENTIMTVYGGPPLPLGRHHMSSLSPRAPARYGGTRGPRVVMAQVCHYPNK